MTTKPFAFASVSTRAPAPADFAVSQPSGVKPFEFERAARSTDGTAQTEELEQADDALSEPVEHEELLSRAQVDLEIEQAKAALRQELQALHQAELEAQSERHELALTEVFSELQRWREAITHQSTELLLRLSETLTLHLVQQSLLEQPERYVTAVTPALKELMGFGRPRLYVPEFAMDALNERLHELKQLHPDHVDVEVLADDTLDTGDFRFEVEGGQVDADLQKRLSHLVEACRQRALATFAEWDEQEDEP